MTPLHDNHGRRSDAAEPSHQSLSVLVDAYVAAFANGDIDALERLYEQSAVLVPVPGTPVTGAARIGASEHLMGLGVPMRAELRRAYQVGDLALLLVDWSMQGTAEDGSAVDLSGSAADVARRGADGQWRYVVDNPFGTT